MSDRRMTPNEVNKLLARLVDLHQKHRRDDDEPWRMVREPHDYDDGTTHFTHVEYTAHDTNGAPVTVMIARFLTPALAELLVLSYNNMPEIVAWARRGVDASGE